MANATKVIISNGGALKAKYGIQFPTIQNAINAWILADSARGITSTYVAVDDLATMARCGGVPAVVGDEKSHKDAVDAVYKSAIPDYVVLLGAPDIIPHISLNNPTYNPSQPSDDPDTIVPSDIPYAVDAPYSTAPEDFIGPTRVVTRLPDIQGANDPDYIVKLIDFAKAAAATTRQAYSTPYLGVSASVWTGSTSLSLSAVFGSAAALQNVPPATYNWLPSQLSALSHFFNCHGASNDSHYYGQAGESYPIAQDAAYINAKIQVGTVLSAECCYGAQLYDPSIVAGQMGIANTYLDNGAFAVWGSTTIAYGPSSTNGQADLICQYFLQEILNGNSIGTAALSARQRFASSSPTLSSSDLKTLVQFICLGDASVRCVNDAAASGTKSIPPSFSLGETVSGWNLQARRAASMEEGRMLSLFKRRATTKEVVRPADTEAVLLRVAAEYGVKAPSITSKEVFEPSGPKLFEAMPNVLVQSQEVQTFHLIFEHLPDGEDFIRRRMLEVGESGGRIVMIRELFSH